MGVTCLHHVIIFISCDALESGSRHVLAVFYCSEVPNLGYRVIHRRGSTLIAQETCAVEMLQLFADNIHYMFNSSQASKARLQRLRAPNITAENTNHRSLVK